MNRRFLLAVVATYAISLVNGFAAPHTTMKSSRCGPASHNSCRNTFAPSIAHITKITSLNNSNNLDNEDELTTVGSKEYYQGFLNRSPSEEPIERVTGDAVLGPTLKFAGGVSLILVGLVLVFLGSNGYNECITVL
mmetsp:Transcript_34469/g.51662  ORF Transcript_34469/g.51662 Transcript_34469/m.51662 type:complete len:136 (+) Transcript_34469:136-543(+)